MSRTNKILFAVLAVLLLILAVIGGVIAKRSGLFGSSDDIAQPFNESRFSGTIDKADGLIDDAVPVVLVVRFHDGGETGELTSPTLKRHSKLTRTGDNTYSEEIVHGDGDNGTKWTFKPKGDEDAMEVSYTTPDGATSSAELPQTPMENNAGEVGLNPNAPDAGPDGIEFPDDGVRELATIEWTDKDDSGNTRTEKAIFRGSREANVFTVTYPERGCYGVLEHVDNVTKTEKITVGDCESGGTWHFTGGDEKKGEAEFTSADETLTGKLTYTATEWDDIEGEIGLTRSGPALDFYREFTDGAYGADADDDKEDTQAKGSCEPEAFDEVVDGWPTPFETIVSFCDGEWAKAAAGGTDDTRGFHFIDGTWTSIKYDGTQEISGYPCYDHDRLRKEGAPDELLDHMSECT
ncbi:hypothetical protein [Corynebacterium sp. p3-SID1194]|uniref:hypothetical protein n=1 Tax=Corynebacterium sp. p3-SID1194 TaxID=2916105 RepID=UPI0021A6F483|nr:hypothetical protein [Corynebacterium sp. p3-SID1194]MCT1451212.1 hypothetical protein [Corynebacterium sp. p3-SID1194]